MGSDFQPAETRYTPPRQLKRNTQRALLAGLISALGMQFASAGPISVGSSLTGGTVSQFTYQTDYAAWLVADLGDPVTPAPLEISPSLRAGRWTQELTFGAGFSNLRTGDTFFLQELLTTGGEILH